MSKKVKKVVEKIYYPQEIPDTLTPRIEELAKEREIRDYNQRTDDVKNLHSVKQQRIQKTNEDKYSHSINTIIEWTEAGKRTIPYLYFNFHYEESTEFAMFLNKLKNLGCFTKWTTNPFKDAYHAEYIFEEVNILLLQQFISSNQIVKFPPNQTVMFHNQVLFFKTGDGTPDSIDFSNAPELRKVFECFWNLRKRSLKEIAFTPSQVVDLYKELFNKAITRHSLASIVSNIRLTKIKHKPNLKERFKIDFNKNEQKWIFLLK